MSRNFELGKEAKSLLQPGMPPRPYLDLLIASGHLEDAARFMAHAMPKREAIWWACRCIRQACGRSLASPEAAALDAAETFVIDPNDENRRQAFQMAEVAGTGTPAGLAGMAVFFSSGSLAPPGLRPVPPADNLAGNMAGNAVILAVTRSQPPRPPAETYAGFYALGFDVASGKERWKKE